ncbi:MAG: hypothetical protein U1F35_05230 [Steroidobacteraceae bacterium]
MNRHRYPRFDSDRKLPENTASICDVIGCNEQAKKTVFIQFSYMRGEDECVKLCAPHAERAIGDPEGLCVSVPQEAWK